jgi:hypothetical protein
MGIGLDRKALPAALHFPSSSLRTSEARKSQGCAAASDGSLFEQLSTPTFFCIQYPAAQALTFSISTLQCQYFGPTLSSLNISSRLFSSAVRMLF